MTTWVILALYDTTDKVTGALLPLYGGTLQKISKIPLQLSLKFMLLLQSYSLKPSDTNVSAVTCQTLTFCNTQCVIGAETLGQGLVIHLRTFKPRNCM